MSFELLLLSDDQVDELLAQEESHFLDFKSIDIAPGKLTKHVSAFANAAGGELYIGVAEQIGDDGLEYVWEGFANQEAVNGHIQVLEALNPLGNYYNVEFFTNGREVGLVARVTVQKTREIVAASDGSVYVRRGAQSLKVKGDAALRRLELDKGISTFEDELTDVAPQEVSESSILQRFMRTAIPFSEPSPFLSKQRLSREGRVSVAGILLFFDEPQAVLPKRSAIKVFRYRTKEDEGARETLAEDPITVEGAAYDLIYAAVAAAKEIVEGIQKLGPKGFENIVYPPEALHEIVTNAVLHRDYSIAADIQIRIYDDRLEIESPGKFPGHVSANNALREQFARNPRLVRLINKFEDPPNKDVGEGLNTAYAAMRNLRLRVPNIEETDTSVLVTLRHESLGSPESIVMEYLLTHSYVTNPIARDLTGIRSENTMKDVFYRLRKSGILEQVPEKRGRAAQWRRTPSDAV